MKKLILTGLNHNTAPVEVRERFSLDEGSVARLAAQGRHGESPVTDSFEACPPDSDVDGGLVLQEYMVISTCNRVEIIAVCKTDDPPDEDEGTAPLNCARLLERWARAKGLPVEALAPHTYSLSGEEVVGHVLAVASGLDSMVLGEPQILGQMKEAYRDAAATHTSGLIINRLMHKAFYAAKRVRTETDIARNPVSVSYAAVELAKRIFDDMSKVRCLLLGAGEMAELAAKYLLSAGCGSFTVINRTAEKAESLAKRYRGRALNFAKLEEALAGADMVISSTSADEPVVNAIMMGKVMKKRRFKPMFFVDIAVPRDIDPAVNQLDNVYVYDIDDLKEVVDGNRKLREGEAVKARAIIDEERVSFLCWLRSLDLHPTIADLVRRGENIARDELEKALRRIGPLPEESVATLEAMVLSVVKKLHHEPLTFLKRRFTEEDVGVMYLNFARRMFNLDNEDVPDSTHHSRKNRPKPG